MKRMPFLALAAAYIFAAPALAHDFIAGDLSVIHPWIAEPLLNAVTVLVIACPHALGLATPVSIVTGIGRGLRRHRQ